VSGAGSKGLLDLDEGTLPLKKFPFPIQGNLIPHIDVFLDNGNTKEEEKTSKKKPGAKAKTDSSIATMGASGLPQIESHFKKQEKDSDDAQAKSKKKSTEEEKE
jgi:hypothetical protein